MTHSLGYIYANRTRVTRVVIDFIKDISCYSLPWYPFVTFFVAFIPLFTVLHRSRDLTSYFNLFSYISSTQLLLLKTSVALNGLLCAV